MTTNTLKVYFYIRDIWKKTGEYPKMMDCVRGLNIKLNKMQRFFKSLVLNKMIIKLGYGKYAINAGNIIEKSFPKSLIIKCGDANPGGSVGMEYKGGCGKELDIREAYRCTGCGGYFHLDCILKHFQLEEGHDNARNSLKIIMELAKTENLIPSNIIKLCEGGIKQNTPIKKK